VSLVAAGGGACAVGCDASVVASPTVAGASATAAADAASTSAASDGALTLEPGSPSSACAGDAAAKSPTPTSAAAHSLQVRGNRSEDARVAAGAFSSKIVCTLPCNSSIPKYGV